MAEKTRYSDAELEEFRAIILEKLELAQRDYELLKASLTGADGKDTDDTSPTYKVLEEGKHLVQGRNDPSGTTPVEVYPRIAGRFGTHREQNVWYLSRNRQVDSCRTSACSASCYIEHRS